MLLLLLACDDPDAVRTDVEAIVMSAAARADRPGYRLQLIVPKGATDGGMRPEHLLQPLLPLIDEALGSCPTHLGAQVTGALHLDGFGGGNLRVNREGPGACLDESMRDTWPSGLPEIAGDLAWLLEITEAKATSP